MNSQAGEANKSRIAKIMVDRNLCIGAVSCVAVAMGVFELDSENKAVLRKKDGTSTSELTNREDLADQMIDDETLLLAAKSCPTMAILVFDPEGNRIYP